MCLSSRRRSWPRATSKVLNILFLTNLDTENGTPQEMIENKGCTAIVTLIKDGTIYVANAGDSRCVAGIGGKAVALSIDHKPTLSREK